MNIVTVTFDRDFDQLLLQADSINKYLTTKTTHWVVVESTSKLHQEWKDRLAPFYTFHELKLMFFGKFQYPVWGYIRQQILKLTISKYIKAESYLILDSKNFFGKETTENDINHLQEGSDWIVNLYQRIYTFDIFLYDKIVKLSNDLNVPVPERIWDIQTPWRMKTLTARKIVDTLDLPYMGYKNEWPNEFILYRLFTDYPIDTADITINPIGCTIWHDNYTTTNNLNFSLYNIQAIHRTCIRDPEMKNHSNILRLQIHLNTILDKRLIDNYFIPIWDEDTRNFR